MDFDSLTLFAANAVILFITAFAFRFAGRDNPGQTYWNTWCAANVVLAAALVFYMFDNRLPDFVVMIAPNGLLVVGFGLRWRAAREFSGRAASPLFVWGPAAAFAALCFVPWLSGSHAAIYAIVNVMLAALGAATAVEFWRDRRDRLPSRYGLVAAYGVLAVSFAVRAGQGIFMSDGIADYLPDDTMLVIHLMVALVHTTATGAFALSIAFEVSAERLRRAAMHDSLTGLLNRGAFEARVQDYLADPRSRPFAIALLDIDHFKQINDRFGHAAGDEAIRSCAALCSAALRDGDAIARIGGEEFAVLLPGASPQDARLTIERMRRAVQAAILPCDGRHIRLTISAGICHGDSGAADFDHLMKLADAGLYRAKDSGRNRIRNVAA